MSKRLNVCIAMTQITMHYKITHRCCIGLGSWVRTLHLRELKSRRDSQDHSVLLMDKRDLWISVRIKPKDVDAPSKPGLVSALHLSVCCAKQSLLSMTVQFG